MEFFKQSFYDESYGRINDTSLYVVETTEKIYVTYNLFRLVLEEFAGEKRWSKIYTLLSAILHQWTNSNPAAFFIRGESELLVGIESIIQLILSTVYKKYFIDEESLPSWRDYSDNGSSSSGRTRSSSISSDSSIEVSKNPIYSHEEPPEGWEAYIKNKTQKLQYKGESFEQILKNINVSASDWISLLSSDFGSKLNTVISLLICTPLLNNIGITPKLFGYEDDIERGLRFNYKKYNKTHLLTILVEHTSWVGLKICTLYNVTKKHGIEAGVRSLFISNQDFADFEDQYMWLKRNSENFSCRSLVLAPDGSPDPFTLEGYMHKCEVALNLATKILPALKHDIAARNRLERSRYDVLSFQSKCAAELRAGESRPFPYAIMLCGPPGIGKSAIKDNCFVQMHMSDNASGRFEIPYNPRLVYTSNPSDDFYSGFSTEHTSILLDDVAQKTPDIIKQNAGDDLADLIQIINKIPFLPNQAELEKKGKTPMRVRYVIGTTNTPDLSVSHVFKCTEAIYRRMVFVEAEVKPEYRMEHSVALAGDTENPTNLDLWNFVIYRYFPTGKNPARRYWNGSSFVNSNEPIKFNLEGLMSFINIDIDKHWIKEERANLAYESVIGAKMCCHGISSAICSKCTTMMAQSYILDKAFGLKDRIVSLSKSIYMRIYFGSVYGLIGIGISYTYLFNKQDVKTPVQPFVWAKNLIDRMPENVPIPAIFRLFTTIPDDIQNYTLLSAGKCAKTYLSAVYLTSVYSRTLSWSEYYFKEYSRLWIIPGAVAFFYSLRYIKRMLAIHAGQSVDFKFPVKDPQEKAKRNYWLKQHHIGVFPNSGSTISQYDIINQGILNTVFLEFEYPDRISTTNAFILKANLLVTVSHCIDLVNLPKAVRVTLTNKGGSLTSVRCMFDESIMYVDINNDLLFIRIDRLPLGRDMTKYLLNESEKVHLNCPGMMISYDRDYNIIENKLSRIENISQCPPYQHKGQYYDTSSCVNARTTLPTQAGQCGGPVMAFQGIHKFIVGIHCAGNGKGMTLVRCLYKEQVSAAEKKLQTSPISDNDRDVCFLAESKGQEITEAHHLCPTNEMLDKEIIVIGGNNLPRSKPRTKVAKSPVAMKVLDFYRPIGYTKINFVSPINCKPKDAIKLSMEKAIENAQFFPKEISFMVEQMSKEFLTRFTPEMLSRLHPYPMSVAINGMDNIPYIDRLNLSTSGGYSHPGPKKVLFELANSTDEHTINYEMKESLRQEVEWILNQYKNGLEANPVFKCSFKDEPITLEKAEKSKVRIFSASPTAFSLVTRMYLLCIIREFVGHRRLSFEMAIGANAHGMDWEEIYQHVIKHGEDRCFAGDYKNFDKQMSPELILGAFEVIINILRAAGWSEDQIQIVRGIAHDTSHPTMDLFGTLIKCFGSNPSGHVLTTPINSLVNSLYIRIATKRILDKAGITPDYSQFSKIISLVTYGDDNCGSISPLYPQVTHTSIQDALGEAGIIYTTDDKKSKSIGLTSVKNITFLKRHFVYDKNLNRTVAPLLEESLFKALTVWTYSNSISIQEQLAAVLDSVNREYFFHGKEKFEKFHSFLCNLAIENEVLEYLPEGKLSSWDDLFSSLYI